MLLPVSILVHHVREGGEVFLLEVSAVEKLSAVKGEHTHPELMKTRTTWSEVVEHDRDKEEQYFVSNRATTCYSDTGLPFTETFTEINEALIGTDVDSDTLPLVPTNLCNNMPNAWVDYTSWSALDVTPVNVSVTLELVEAIRTRKLTQENRNSAKMLAMFESYDITRVFQAVGHLL